MSSLSLRQRILGPYRISHHPLCLQFEDHVYQIRGKKVCRGCTMQYSGILVSFLVVVVGMALGWWIGVTEIQLGILLYLMIFPTFLTAFFIENRKIKDVSRFLLGFAFIIAFVLLIVTPNWLIKGWIILNFLPGYIFLSRRRSKKNDVICVSCVEHDNMPNCSGLQIFVDRESIFMSQETQGGIRDPFSLSPNDLQDET